MPKTLHTLVHVFSLTKYSILWHDVKLVSILTGLTQNEAFRLLRR